MDNSRLDLQAVLEDLLGSEEAYYQPPHNVEMTYPAIVYDRVYGVTDYADNQAYHRRKRWSVIVISRNPDEPVADLVEKLPYCTFDREYRLANLNHKVFNLYF